MAGIGEAYSHIAGVHFAAEANTQVKQQQSCTLLPCAWLPPLFTSDEHPCLKLTSEHQTKKEQSNFWLQHNMYCQKSLIVQKSTEAELMDYYLIMKLSKTKHKPVLLSLVNGVNDYFVPLYIKGIFTQPLTTLYNQKHQEILFP